MNKLTQEIKIIKRSVVAFDVEIRDTTGRARDLILGGWSFDSQEKAERFARRLEEAQ